jgi:Tfp pilus assembly protein PilX
VSVVVVVIVLLVVAWLVLAPLRPGAAERARQASASERDELEALKEAKYREIRDAELDYRTGKLSETDWRDLDRGLRAEAVAILHRLDDLD